MFIGQAVYCTPGAKLRYWHPKQVGEFVLDVVKSEKIKRLVIKTGIVDFGTKQEPIIEIVDGEEVVTGYNEVPDHREVGKWLTVDFPTGVHMLTNKREFAVIENYLSSKFAVRDGEGVTLNRYIPTPDEKPTAADKVDYIKDWMEFNKVEVPSGTKGDLLAAIDETGRWNEPEPETEE